MKFEKKHRLLTMLALTSLFFLAEIITGYMTNSMALVADSFHMLSDVLSLIIAYVAVHYSTKKSKTNTYDWARAEVLGAMANAVFLMALVFTIVVGSIQRLILVEEITQPLLVLGVGGAGLLINVIGLVIFGGHAHHGHSHGHSHDHGHDHGNGQHHSHGHAHESHHKKNQPLPSTDQTTSGAQGEPTEEKRGKETASQMNMHGVFLHVLGDALGSVVVIISALIIHFVQDDWKFYVDPVMSLVISIIISWTTIPLLRRASMILLQNPPTTVDMKAVKEKVAQVAGVISIHDLHVWQLSGNCVIASVHVIVRDGCNFTEIARQLKKIFHEVDIHSTTIQPEFYAGKSFDLRALDGAAEELNVTCQCVKMGRVLEGVPHTCAALPKGIYRKFSNDSRCDDGGSPNEPGSDSNSCLLSCLSENCSSRMCCDGMRSTGNAKTLRGFDNPLAVEETTGGSVAVEIDRSGPSTREERV